MKLENLERTTLLCLEHHEARGNHSKVYELKEKLKHIKESRIEDDGPHLEQKPETFGDVIKRS